MRRLLYSALYIVLSVILIAVVMGPVLWLFTLTGVTPLLYALVYLVLTLPSGLFLFARLTDYMEDHLT